MSTFDMVTGNDIGWFQRHPSFCPHATENATYGMRNPVDPKMSVDWSDSPSRENVMKMLLLGTYKIRLNGIKVL